MLLQYDMMTRSYERIAANLLKGQPKAKRSAMFIDGRLLTGTKSLHRTAQSRRWRMFWRIKQVRPSMPSTPRNEITIDVQNS